MGLFEKIFKKPNQAPGAVRFETFTAYNPSFSGGDSNIYEMEITRACIDTYARHCAKLKPEIRGSAYKNLEKTLQFKPNPYMSTYQFLYRLATSLMIDTTAFIIPLYADDLKTVTGLYPLQAGRAEILTYQGEEWIRYTFANGKRAAIELSKVGILTRFQGQNEFFGGGNSALNPTLSLLAVQKQGMEEGTKQAASIRFMAKLAGQLRNEDIEKEKDRFSKNNLSSDNQTGVMMFDSKYSEIKQIDSKPFVMDANQLKLIRDGAFNYIGINENIVQGKYSEQEFDAFYESLIEPFAIQVGLAVTNMLFTEKEKSYGNEVMLTANRLQYASTKTKLEVIKELSDRGRMSINESREILQMSNLGEMGDKYHIRLEYGEVENLNKIQEVEEQ